MMLPQSLVKVTNDAQLYLLNAFHATLNWVSDRSEYLISSNCAHSCILVRPIPILVRRTLTLQLVYHDLKSLYNTIDIQNKT